MARNQVRLEIERREPFAEGKSFGDTGAYERLVGKVHFAIDPDEDGLPYICDLDLAPRNAEGLVEFAATLDVIKPVDLDKGNRRLFYEFSNRGNRSAMRFNDGLALDPGNGFLMRKGYTIVFSGWQGDLIDTGTNIVAYLPEALENGRRLRGAVRQEFIAATEDVLSIGVSAGAENGITVQPYPVLDRASATLTLREKAEDARQPVPNDAWELAKAERQNGSVVVTPSDVDLHVKGGFKPGWIYELIYETEGSRVMGLGFLGVRDLLSFLRHDAVDAAGTPNPLAGYVDKVYAWGVSLCGRTIRQYIYEGWNVDAAGRRIFDAVQTHTGSGRLFHNQRFAQVGRYPRQHEEHEWPSEKYPFTFVAVPDPFTERNEGILQRPESDPLVMHTHTSSDYWERHVSLNHTDPRDGSDVEIPETVRMYVMTGSPHMPRAVNDPAWIGQLTPNSMSPNPYLRACLVLMDRWAADGVPPPASRLPKQSEGTLIDGKEALARYPKMPGVNLPSGPSRRPNYDYGPNFEKGYASVFPPKAVPGQEYPVQVPLIDADGNDVPGLRYPDVEVPVGTHLSWALRRAPYAEGEMLWTTGSFSPFARTKAERAASGDQRPSIEERYASHDDYVQQVTRVCERLVGERLMLGEDAERYVEAARRKNPFDPSIPLGPLLQVGGG